MMTGHHRCGVSNGQPVDIHSGTAAIDPREQAVVRPWPCVRADDKGVASYDADGASGRIPDRQNISTRSRRCRARRLDGDSAGHRGEWVLGSVGIECVAGRDCPDWRKSSTGRGEFDEVDGIEGDEKIAPVSGGCKIYANTEKMHAARSGVELGNAVPTV